jgi:hypothetical protein
VNAILQVLEREIDAAAASVEMLAGYFEEVSVFVDDEGILAVAVIDGAHVISLEGQGELFEDDHFPRAVERIFVVSRDSNASSTVKHCSSLRYFRGLTVCIFYPVSSQSIYSLSSISQQLESDRSSS